MKTNKHLIKIALGLLVLTTNTTIVKSQSSAWWNLFNFGASRYLENNEKNLLHFHLYQNNKKRFVLTHEVISMVPGFSNQNYPVFLSENCNGFFDKSFLTNGSAVMSSLHSQNRNGSSFSGSTYQTSDWGQNIQSYVSRARTVSFVVNQIPIRRDVAYVLGDGAYGGKSFFTLSDVNLKNNIATITGALSKVNALRGVYFKYKADSCIACDTSMVVQNDETTHMGLIAQEVEAIVPEVVRDQYTGFKAIAYSDLVGLLIEAIKELDAKVNGCCGIDLSSGLNTIPSQENKNVLFQNNPNPFDNATEIKYFVHETTRQAAILVFDMSGKELKRINISQKGNGIVTITSTELPAGMYYYSLIADNKEVDTKKMILTSK